MNNTNRNIKNLHEMVFIYNAVMDGWTVRKRSSGKIRFKRKHSRQYDVDLPEFINNNTQLQRHFNINQ